MLVNPGGPGGSGLGLATLGKSVPNNVGDAYDWIGFDPRGVGLSRPALSCLPYYFSGPRLNYVPLNDTLENIWLMRSKDYAMACATNNLKLLQYMTTIDIAKDMESIRVALSQDQISYYGFSYGTYLGQVYATLFPDRVRRMVLDSNVDARMVWFQANLNQDLAFEPNIKIWFRWLAKYNNVFHLGQTESQVEKQWNSTLKQLENNPFSNIIGPDEWLDIFLLAAYFQQTWIDLGTTFADWVNKNDGDSLMGWYEAVENPVRTELHIPPSAIHNELSSVYGDQVPSLRTVQRSSKSFREGREEIEDEVRPGRPITETTAKNIGQARLLIDHDPYITIEKVQEQTDLSYGTVQRIISGHLKLRKLTARYVPKDLNDFQRSEQIRICKKNLANFQKETWRLCDVVTGDESWFYHQQIGRKSSNVAWVAIGDPLPIVIQR
ncbi:unnamed protein product, partial [Rotaria sp. Silwood1]